ncbi:MAG: hypothetical protein KC933_21345 [Myxococcales bacterium]|nr:hypothetical protein [Myxococcales bacterium]MCB9646834.1 hypothetical protein [Deltaproteobacteria bacterium]
MLLEVQSALIGVFVTVAVMTSMLLRRRRRRTDALFVVLCVILLIWFSSVFLTGYFGTDPWLRIELAVGSLIPAGVIRLFSELVPWHTQRGRKLMNSAYTLSGLSAVAAISPLGDLQATRAVIGIYVAATILVASRLMTESEDVGKGTVEYVRRRYLAIGAALVSVLAIVGEAVGGSISAAGHLAVMLYVFFLSQVILRERLLDLNEFVGRMLILSILAALFGAISALLVTLGSNTSTRLFGAIIGVVILLTLYEPLKQRLETKAIELFFRERHRFIMALEDVRRAMQHGVLDPAKMSRIVADALYDSRRATHVAVYLLEPLGNGFALHAFRGPEPAPRVNATDLPELWKAIQQSRAPLLTEQISRQQEDDEEAPHHELLDALRSVSADLLLPFVSGEAVLGFLALRDDRSLEAFSTAEIASLMKIAETAATVIWNSRLAERLRERERLAAIGAMAAGLAHEIRNPLGAIKGAAEYLDPTSMNEEDGQFLEVIIEETNRLNSVVSQFLDYARPFRARFAPANLNEVVQKTARLVEAQHKDSEVRLELDLGELVPEITADAEQIKQVILNLILNGLDASTDGVGPVTLTTRHRPERGCVELRVRDQGSGIPPEDLDQIFIPFFTTKQHGTGLGLAVCYRIITAHGGTIVPVSRVGEGTEFIVQLPLARPEVGSVTGSFVKSQVLPAGKKGDSDSDPPRPRGPSLLESV